MLKGNRIVYMITKIIRWIYFITLQLIVDKIQGASLWLVTSQNIIVKMVKVINT